LKSSGGIETGTLAAPSESLALSERDSVVLDATEDEISLAIAEEEAASGMATRSADSIRLVVESLKSSFNKLYVRELRKDPFLEGLLMLEVVIEPSGEVSFCRVVSSELDHEVLEGKIVKRMYLANFGVENVLQTTINIPFPFKPN
jgi:outer membrane biosynthesis protein TonB